MSFVSLYRSEREGLGSKIVLQLPRISSAKAKRCSDLLYQEIERIEKNYSRFRHDSQLTYLNNNLGVWHKISDEMHFLLKKTEELRHRTEGAFNIGVESLLRSWGYDADYSLQNKDDAITHVPPEPIELKAGSVRLWGTIDLGGVGKGFFLQKSREILHKNEVEDFFVNAGGDLLADGYDEKGNDWRYYLADPDDEKKIIASSILGKKWTMAFASSPYYRQWGSHHHLVQISTAQPARTMRGVYVQTNDGIAGDGWATALFTMSLAQAKKYLTQINFSETDLLETMLIDADGGVWRSDGFTVKTTQGRR